MSKSGDTITAVIIRRSNEENTVAIVEAEVDPEMEIYGPNELCGAIANAVTKWIAPGGEGKMILDGNGGDFNVGDLENALDSIYLQTHLRREGILHLDVTCYVGDQTRWDFDDNLYCEDPLE